MWPWLTTDEGFTCKTFNDQSLITTDCHSIYIDDTQFKNFNPLKKILIDPCVNNYTC